jgi:RNA recognition motif-containing protein
VPTTLFVGNLSFTMTDADLHALFAAVAPVESARVIVDRETQRPRGFGFVTMQNPDAAAEAQRRLDGSRAFGRALVVMTARERVPR